MTKRYPTGSRESFLSVYLAIKEIIDQYSRRHTERERERERRKEHRLSRKVIERKASNIVEHRQNEISVVLSHQTSQQLVNTFSISNDNMNSIRNAPVDIASTRIVHYLRTHNYDDCAIYINRLSSHTFRKILANDLSIDILLAQLPFSIEVFEVIYSKVFIHDPDYFPLRILKPEQIISKMISVFASTVDATTSIVSKSKEMGIDDERLLSNLSSILRIVSYVQPILFKRLVRQKETIDECIFYFEQRSLSTVNLLQDTLRHELESTITCCQQAIHKLENTTVSSTSRQSTPVAARKQRPSTSSAPPTPSSFDEVQNRLFQHKSILNLVEPYLSRTKLYSVMENLTTKVSMDKQILLAFSHIKSHEKQIPFGEPLLPLFKRFAFAYERNQEKKKNEDKLTCCFFVS